MKKHNNIISGTYTVLKQGDNVRTELPKLMREHVGIEAGDKVTITLNKRTGDITIRKVE